MLFQLFILMQIISIFVFYLSFKTGDIILNTSLLVLATILFSVVAFSAYNIEFVKSYPDKTISTESTDSNNITTTETTYTYSKFYMYHQSIPLFWLNFLMGIISFIMGLLSVFNAADMGQIWKLN